MTKIEELLLELDQLAYRVDRMPVTDVEAKLERVSAELRKHFVKLAAAPVAAKALEYIYGHVADEVWAGMVEERATPPWPLEKHLRPMGFYTQQTVHDALVETIMAHPGGKEVSPHDFVAEVIKRMKA